MKLGLLVFGSIALSGIGYCGDNPCPMRLQDIREASDVSVISDMLARDVPVGTEGFLEWIDSRKGKLYVNPDIDFAFHRNIFVRTRAKRVSKGWLVDTRCHPSVTVFGDDPSSDYMPAIGTYKSAKGCK